MAVEIAIGAFGQTKGPVQIKAETRFVGAGLAVTDLATLGVVTTPEAVARNLVPLFWQALGLPGPPTWSDTPQSA